MKMNLVAKLVSQAVLMESNLITTLLVQIRKMSVGNALAQVQFCEKKAAQFVEMVIYEYYCTSI